MRNDDYFAIIIGILVVVLALTTLDTGAMTPQERQSTFDAINSKAEIDVCYIVWPPSVIKNPDTGKVSGFLVDLFKDISDDAVWKVHMIESTWGGFPADLNSNKCDIAVAGIYPTIKRSTSVSFTRPFFYAGNSAVVRRNDNRFRNIGDLNDASVTIAVIQGEYGHIYAQKYLPKAKLLILDKGSDNTMPLVSVSSGKADAGLIMSDVVKEYAKKHNEVKDLFPDNPYSTTPITFAVRSGDQKLLNFLNNAINYLEATGTLKQSGSKYDSEWFVAKNEYERLRD